MDVHDLLPPGSGLRAREPAVAPGIVAVVAEATSSSAACPGCGSPSEHVHGHYIRTLADLPWQGRRVALRLAVRRFQCRNPACPKRTFTERFPGVAPYAQATARLAEAHRAIGFALGGEPGSRLAERLAVPTSPDTLLRRVRQGTPGDPPSPRVPGIDDFAFRKGRTYGTILVDLEHRRVVDLLPDREAATRGGMAEGPSRHRGHHEGPGLGLRTGGPRGGPRRGAGGRPVAPPEEPARRPRAGVATALVGHPGPALGPGGRPPAGTASGTTEGAAGGPSEGPRSDGQHRRRAVFEQVRQLHREGHSLRGIAAALRLHYRTVERYARSDACPDWCPGRRRACALDRFEGHIRRRLSEGYRNRRRLRDELAAMGYRGGKSAVRDYVRRLEAEMGLAPGPAPPAPPRPAADIPSARGLAVAVVIRPEDRTEEGRWHLDTLCSGDAAIREAVGLAEGFAAPVRGRSCLPDWLSRAEGSSVAGLRSFAVGIRQDEEAVRAGMDLEWSNGPVEGHVNRVKAIKRTMYGRAGFDLLKARVLHAG